jgi:lauroyl/myristoyl acyltransferase
VTERVPLVQNVHQVRRLVPVRWVPGVVRRRLDRLWADDDFRAAQEAEMEFLLGKSERAAESAQLGRPYAEQMMIRAYLRWHPRAITRQRVEGIEWLTTRRDRGRGTILSFTHHHRYDGMFGSLARLGAPSTMAITSAITRPEAGIAFQQHLRVASRGGGFVVADGGIDDLVAVLRDRGVLAIAPDVPGRTPVTFLGRRVLGSFGTPRLATMTNSPVVLVTHRRDERGPYLRVHEPLEPSDYATPEQLLEDILSRHGEAILDWPEALESPGARFGKLAE